VQPPAWRVRKIVIAAINRPAIGIGLTLALQCDVRLVAEDAQLAIPQARRGMIADCRAHFTLRQAVGLAVAADVLPAAIEMARDVAMKTSPASVALSKRLLWADLDPDEVAHEETLAHRLLMGSADAREGAAAWRERRAPEWRSRASETGDPA
jgi:enoyl-CoA hydratase/carnithine racemase